MDSVTVVGIASSALVHNHLGRLCAESDELRNSLSTLYQNQSCILFYQRLKDSLKHGVLSTLEESIQRATLINTDVRLKGLSINLWTKSYDSYILQTAVEVVRGCKLADFINPDRVRSQGLSGWGKKEANKQMERFIASPFLRNLDTAFTGSACVTMSSPRCPARSCQQTVLKILILIHLLHVAKVQGTFLPNLFIASSLFKYPHFCYHLLAI